MASIVIRNYGGMALSANWKMIDESIASYAKNLFLRFGDFRPMPLPSNMGAIAAGLTLYRFETAGTFISSAGDVNYVRGPIPTDITERTYYTGDGAPKVTDNGFIVRQLGVPQPLAAPTVLLIESNAYTEDVAAVAMGTKSSEFTTMIWNACTTQYVGLEVADYSPSFVTSTEAWEFRFAIAGVLASGVFTPTNASHAALMGSDFGFYTETVGPTTTGYVNLTLRGQTVAVAATLATSLATISDPSDATGIRDLLSAAQITAIVADLTNGLKPADTARDASITRLKRYKSSFVALANGGAAGSVAANKAEMTAFYARVDVAADITAALVEASEAIAAAMDGFAAGYGGV